jgi:hypothetical protein
MKKLRRDQRHEPSPGSEAGEMDRLRAKTSRAWVADWLEHYKPTTVDVHRWVSLRSFVLSGVGALEPQGRSIAARYARALTRLADWCATQGLALDLEIVLDPDSVERFIATLPRNQSTATYRADLRRIGRRLTERAPWEPLPEPVSRRAVAPPYSPEELASLRRFAANQSTAERRRRATALIALGAGAGLDGRWCTKIKPQDLRRTASELMVRVGAPCPRIVPVLASFEADLENLRLSSADEVVVGGAYHLKNRASDLAARLDRAPGCPRLSSSRLRSTWLVHHLILGTRLPELAEAAGLAGVTVLSDLLEFVPRLPPQEANRQLRGSSL